MGLFGGGGSMTGGAFGWGKGCFVHVHIPRKGCGATV